MRTLVVVTMVALIAGCAPMRMRGFDAVAAAGDRIDVRGIPAWASGSFVVGTDGTRGRVRRVAVGETIVDDPLFDRFPEIENSLVGRRGRYAFEVRGPGVGGVLNGACRYGRTEARTRVGAVSVAEPALPLSLHCLFARDGRADGRLDLAATPVGGAPIALAARDGQVVADGATLQVRSVHRGEEVAASLDAPLGYVFAADEGVVGAVDLASGTRARLAVPRDPARRRAATAAGIALALFWDPGDTD